jgi:hypothetical protein
MESIMTVVISAIGPAIISGAILGAACVALVVAFGLKFIETRRTVSAYGEGRIKYFFRGILAIVSAVLIVVGFLTAALANGLPFYAAWLVTYLTGLGLYFFVRYRVLKR